MRWTGRFTQTGTSGSAVLSRTTAVGHPTAYGSITILPIDSAPPRSKIDVDISAPSVDGGSQVAWAVFTGPCGSATPPITGLDEFPVLEISSGVARVSTEVNFFMNPAAEYHANVYWSGRASDVSNVMMCANLTKSR